MTRKEAINGHMTVTDRLHPATLVTRRQQARELVLGRFMTRLAFAISWPAAGQFRTWVRAIDPVRRSRQAHWARWRREAIGLLASFAEATTERFSGTVLIDGSWDNPNYWIRYALVSRALGLGTARQIGFLGPYNTKVSRATFARFGVGETVTLHEELIDRSRLTTITRQLMDQSRRPEDILRWRLPQDFPADFVYDGILKRQQTASIQTDDPRLPEYVQEAVEALAVAEALLDRMEVRLLLLSHVINCHCAALGWVAARRGIPTLVLYGDYGMSRFARITKPEDLYATMNMPDREQLDRLPPDQAEQLAAAGLTYLERRLAGQTHDVGARYAFGTRHARLDRTELCRRFGWSLAAPIMVVYVPTWFDFPHMYGARAFRDFLDWFEATLVIARRTPQIYWLFRAHPCEAWYGGIRLRDIMPRDEAPHIRLLPEGLNGAEVMACVDGVVTYHGTAGLEYAAFGKPVLLADRGWYHDLGIAKWPGSREEYLAALGRPWWQELDLRETTRRARILAGWCFCVPSWQRGFVLQDDSVQEPIYGDVPRLWAEEIQSIEQEVDTLRAWYESGARHYHTFKVANASGGVVEPPSANGVLKAMKSASGK